MTEQEKAISRLCLAIQDCCNELREEYSIDNDSYYMNSIECFVEQIHRRVNPGFNKICEDVEAFERAGEEQDDDG